MEKLFRLKTNLFYLLLFISILTYSQDKLCVIETTGNPHIQNKTEYKSINKGDVFNKNLILQLENAEAIKLIDEKGELYQLDAPGSYTLNKVLEHKKINEKASVTKKYFNYLFKKMMNDVEKNSNAGVVYRTKPVGSILQPLPKTQIIKEKIYFEWVNDNHINLTFKIIDSKTKKSKEIETNGSFLTLNVDGVFFRKGGNYTWSLSDANHQSDSTNFSILTDIQITNLKQDIKVFKKELIDLDFKEDEINKLIAEKFTIQY